MLLYILHRAKGQHSSCHPSHSPPPSRRLGLSLFQTFYPHLYLDHFDYWHHWIARVLSTLKNSRPSVPSSTYDILPFGISFPAHNLKRREWTRENSEPCLDKNNDSTTTKLLAKAVN